MATPPAPPLLELLQSADGVVDVCARIRGELRNLTQFPHVHHIYDQQASPDGRWAFVWYMDYPPRRLAVFDLRTGERYALFMPGSGGVLDWVVDNRILHRWGAGTGVRCFQVLDTLGSVLHSSHYDAFELSPDARRLVAYPVVLAGSPLFVLDLRTFEETRPDVLPRGGRIEALTWLADHVLEVTYEIEDSGGGPRHVRLDVGTTPPRAVPATPR